MRNANRRFEKFAKKLGFKILKGRVFRDVDEVVWKKLGMFAIPSRLNAYHNSLHLYRGTFLPHLEEMETKARLIWFRNKHSFFYQENIKEYANQKFNPQEYEISQQD